MAFDTARLLTQVKIKGCLPTGRYEDSELLELAYDVMLSEIVPMLIALKEEYYGRKHDTAIVASQASYPIIPRAFAGVLRDVKLVTGNTITDLERRDPESVSEIRTGTPDGFYLEGNDIVLDPTPSAATGSLRQLYFLRPSRFVTVSECAQITAIDTATNTVTASVPASWSTANTFDLIKGRAHFDILSYDLAASSVSSGSVQFSASLPATLTVGDYVCLAEETAFPFLPIEGHTALVQATAAAAQEAIGMPQAAETAAKAKMLKENFKTTLSVRVQGAPKPLGVRII